MSYDLEIYYKVEPTRVPQERSGDNYHVGAGEIDPIEPEDLDESIADELKGYRYVSHVTIEGNYEAGYAALRPDLDAALADGGAIVDQQNGTIAKSGRVAQMKWVEPAPRVERATLSIFFEADPEFEADRFDDFIALMQRYLPEALPRRYGPHEPPRFMLEREGLAHFKVTWRSDPSLVWYAHKPVEYVFTTIRNDERESKSRSHLRGFNIMGFRSSRIEILATDALVKDSALSERAESFLREAANLVDAFYAEMRMGEASVKSWWWKGLPPSPPLCFALGPPYVGLWQEAEKGGEPLGSGSVWISRESQARLHLKAPPRLAHPPEQKLRGPHLQPYAKRFPFPRPGTIHGDAWLLYRKLFGRRRGR